MACKQGSPLMLRDCKIKQPDLDAWIKFHKKSLSKVQLFLIKTMKDSGFILVWHSHNYEIKPTVDGKRFTSTLEFEGINIKNTLTIRH